MLIAERAGDTEVLAMHVPSLWHNRHQLKPIATEFAALSALMSHLTEALGLAERQWKEGYVPQPDSNLSLETDSTERPWKGGYVPTSIEKLEHVESTQS